MIISGNTVGTPMPRTNYEQTDPKKADYLKGKDVLDQKIAAAKKAGTDAQTAAGGAQAAVDQHSQNDENPHGVTAEQVGARPSNWMPTASQVGARPDTWMPSLDDIGAQARHMSVSYILEASNWVDNTQTISIGGLSGDDTVIVSPSPESHEAYCEAGVYCYSQGNGALTFKCADVPATTLKVNVVLLGASGVGGGATYPDAEGGLF